MDAIVFEGRTVNMLNDDGELKIQTPRPIETRNQAPLKGRHPLVSYELGPDTVRRLEVGAHQRMKHARVGSTPESENSRTERTLEQSEL